MLCRLASGSGTVHRREKSHMQKSHVGQGKKQGERTFELVHYAIRHVLVMTISSMMCEKTACGDSEGDEIALDICKHVADSLLFAVSII